LLAESYLLHYICQSNDVEREIKHDTAWSKRKSMTNQNA